MSSRAYTKRVSEDTEKAYLKGEVLTVAEIKQRYSIALTINNEDIIRILFNAEKPVSSKELQQILKLTRKEPMNSRLRRLFKDKLVVRFWTGGYSYLLSEKGYNKYKEMKVK